jgi:protein-tyrosine kinase
VSKIYDALKRAEREREEARERAVARDREPSLDLPHVEETPPALDIEPDVREEDDYRRLRASLLSTPSYSDLHSILVTATRHGEGATRVAVGLARALASDAGTRVLLFEANLRTPSLVRRAISGNHGKGLSDLLAGQAKVDELVTVVPEWNISIVPAGAAVGVVNCEAILDALAELTPKFDFVIVDAPPVNRYADVSVLAPRVDGVILVVEADETPVVDAESAKRSLDRVGARIFGVVLNRRRSYVPPALRALM